MSIMGLESKFGTEVLPICSIPYSSPSNPLSIIVLRFAKSLTQFDVYFTISILFVKMVNKGCFLRTVLSAVAFPKGLGIVGFAALAVFPKWWPYPKPSHRLRRCWVFTFTHLAEQVRHVPKCKNPLACA